MLQVEFLALTKKTCIFAIVRWCKLKTFSATTITRVKVFLSCETVKLFSLKKYFFFTEKRGHNCRKLVSFQKPFFWKKNRCFYSQEKETSGTMFQMPFTFFARAPTDTLCF
jgi:hypothetical protein